MHLPLKLVKFLNCHEVNAFSPGSGGMPPRYIGVDSFRKSLLPSFTIDLANPLSTLRVKFFFIAISSTTWYTPSDTISKLNYRKEIGINTCILNITQN